MKNGRAILNRDFEQVSFPSLSLVFPPLFQTLYERGLFTFNSRKIEREREREREREKRKKNIFKRRNLPGSWSHVLSAYAQEEKV